MNRNNLYISAVAWSHEKGAVWIEVKRIHFPLIAVQNYIPFCNQIPNNNGGVVASYAVE